MEGHKGEKSHAIAVYDLDQRRLIDAEITRRTINFMKTSVGAHKPFYAYVPFTLVHFPTLPNLHLPERPETETFPMRLRKWTHMLVKFSMPSTT